MSGSQSQAICILSTDVFCSPSQAFVSFLLMALVHHLKPFYPFYWCLWFTISGHCILSTDVWFTISSYLYPFYWCLWFTISSHCILSTDVFSSPSQAIVSFLLMSLVHHLKPLYPFYWCLHVHHLKPLYPFYWCLWFTISSHCILFTDVWFTISSHCILSTDVFGSPSQAIVSFLLMS